MRKFLAKHAAATTGTVSGFDRVLFKGHLPLGYPHAMEEFLQRHGVLFKRLKGFVLQQAERLRTHSHVMGRASEPALAVLRVPGAQGRAGPFISGQPLRTRYV